MYTQTHTHIHIPYIEPAIFAYLNLEIGHLEPHFSQGNTNCVV